MQENTQVATTPPLSGADLAAQINKALQTIATDFSGSDDPAAKAWPFCTWADTGNMLLKRRNAAGTAWVVVGPLLSYGSAALTFKAAPAVAADDVVVQSQVFGVGQTWQNVSALRTDGVVYTNSTGKPIVVRYAGQTLSGGGSVTAYCNDKAVSNGAWSAAGFVIAVNFTVLPGETYKCASSNMDPSARLWVEIRG